MALQAPPTRPALLNQWLIPEHPTVNSEALGSSSLSYSAGIARGLLLKDLFGRHVGLSAPVVHEYDQLFNVEMFLPGDTSNSGSGNSKEATRILRDYYMAAWRFEQDQGITNPAQQAKNMFPILKQLVAWQRHFDGMGLKSEYISDSTKTLGDSIWSRLPYITWADILANTRMAIATGDGDSYLALAKMMARVTAAG